MVLRVQIFAGLVEVIRVVVVQVVAVVQVNAEFVVLLLVVRKSTSSGKSTSSCRSHVADSHL